jgi:hypothetical protein
MNAKRKPISLAPIELGTRMVDDPYERGARLEVVVNLLESPLDRWRAHQDIDLAQYEAGERFRSAWERVGIGGARAFDWRREAVDGGKLRDPLSDGFSRAAATLRDALATLGGSSYRLVVQVIGERKFPSTIAKTKFEEKYFSRLVRDSLTELAERWGMIAHGRVDRRYDGW